MIRVRYAVEFTPEDRPTTLDGSTNAVLADTRKEYDVGQGGVTRAEVNPEDVAALVTYPVGSELFAESGLSGDVLDDSTDEAATASRIWWRVVVVER